MQRPLAYRFQKALSKRYTQHGTRHISILSLLPAVLVPPVVFGGLVISLWMYKVRSIMSSILDVPGHWTDTRRKLQCAMMVLFQNKIIYMPGSLINPKHVHQFANNLLTLNSNTSQASHWVPNERRYRTISTYSKGYNGTSTTTTSPHPTENASPPSRQQPAAARQVRSTSSFYTSKGTSSMPSIP